SWNATLGTLLPYSDFALAVQERQKTKAPSERDIRGLMQQSARKDHRVAGAWPIAMRPIFGKAQTAAFELVRVQIHGHRKNAMGPAVSYIVAMRAEITADGRVVAHDLEIFKVIDFEGESLLDLGSGAVIQQVIDLLTQGTRTK